MDVNFIWIGYCNRDNHDKVWGILCMNNFSGGVPHGTPVHIFWGGRGKSLSFKSDKMNFPLHKLIDTKEGKGYRRISATDLRSMCTDFDDTLKQRLTLHILSQ